jgi:hypothetical protein
MSSAIRIHAASRRDIASAVSLPPAYRATANPCLFVCIRIPKCASTSLAMMLTEAFRHRRIFYLPHTLDLDGAVSRYQRARFLRTRTRNLCRAYRSADLSRVCRHISRVAQPGDLITGGHIEYGTVARHMTQSVKIITMLREPGARCRSEYDYFRINHARRSEWSRWDCGLREKMAGRYDYDGYLDFLVDHRAAYSDIAARLLGWTGPQATKEFAGRHIFHCGVAENSRSYASSLSQKLGIPLTLPSLNATRHMAHTSMPLLTRRQRAKIELLYARDFALYEWAFAYG